MTEKHLHEPSHDGDKSTVDFLTLITIMVCFIMFGGFFFGSDYFINSYITERLWNLGHIVFFFFFSLLVLRFRPEPSLYRGLIKTTAIALSLGLIIEISQTFVGRQGSLADISFNLIGAGIAALWFYRRKTVKGKKRLWASYACLLLIAATPLLLGVGNKILSYWQYPVLLDFSYSLEQMRLNGSADIQVAPFQQQPGAMITFGKEQYSGFNLGEFYSDWRDQQQLVIELVNLDKTLPFTCRVHDQHHNQAYNDRYNRRWQLPTGPQTLIMTVDDIRQAPKARDMDMANVAKLICFTTLATEQPRIFLKKIYLR